MQSQPFSKNMILPQKISEHASAFVHTKFDGAWRPVALKTEIEFSLDKNDVRLKFSLPPGHYATTVCREFMKADPVQMI